MIPGDTNAQKQELIRKLCDFEWQMFDQVNNVGGRASCQEDPTFFKKMRACQFAVWNEPLLESYLEDLEQAAKEGRNLPAEKYGYMMENTHPLEFQRIQNQLPAVDTEKKELIRAIVAVQLAWEQEVDREFPYMRSGGRPLRKEQDSPEITSFETYLDGELKTYSVRTLRIYSDYIHDMQKQGLNLARFAAEQTASAYGYASLEDAEKNMRLKYDRFIR